MNPESIIHYQDGVASNKINEELLNNGYRMDRGYGKFKGKAFRVPHMGNIYMQDLKDYLNKIDEILCRLKY